MQRLYNKKILVGREEGNGRLVVAMNVNGQVRTAFLGQMHSVPNYVSRYRPDRDSAHCSLDINPAGNILLTNLNETNTTFVDDSPVMTKKVMRDSKISLGRKTYNVTVATLLDAALRLIPVSGSVPGSGAGPVPAKEYSIRHLERVWDKYHEQELELAKKRQRDAVISRLYMPLMIVSGGIGALASYLSQNGSPSLFMTAFQYIMYALAVVFLFVGLYKTIVDKSIEEKEELLQDFQDSYVCPNPDCRHFVGMTPYRILKQNKGCPYCKSKWISE